MQVTHMLPTKSKQHVGTSVKSKKIGEIRILAVEVWVKDSRFINSRAFKKLAREILGFHDVAFDEPDQAYVLIPAEYVAKHAFNNDQLDFALLATLVTEKLESLIKEYAKR